MTKSIKGRTIFVYSRSYYMYNTKSHVISYRTLCKCRMYVNLRLLE